MFIIWTFPVVTGGGCVVGGGGSVVGGGGCVVGGGGSVVGGGGSVVGGDGVVGEMVGDGEGSGVNRIIMGRKISPPAEISPITA